MQKTYMLKYLYILLPTVLFLLYISNFNKLKILQDVTTLKKTEHLQL